MRRNKLNRWLMLTILSWVISFVFRAIDNNVSQITVGEVGVRLLIAMLLSLIVVNLLPES